MGNTPKQVYDLFRESMITKTDAWKDLISDNVELVGPLVEAKGQENFIAINTPFFASILSSELHELVESGHKIITRISTTVGLPDGESLTLKVSEWYHIEDGKITSLITYFDSIELRKVFEVS